MRVCSLESRISCCAAGLAGIVVRSVLTVAVVKQMKMKLKSWDRFLLKLQPGCLESRRPSSPLIDIKPIEFGIIGAKKEIVQPTVLRKTYTPDDYFRKFEPRLYSLDSNSDDMDSLTDEEILSKYQLGMLHFSTQYDLLHNYLIVRVIEAKDLPPPISYDGSRQDMAHSNPYVKICLLPDQKNSKQTGVKRKTQNPVFEERYTFEIPFLEAQRRTLLLTVVDFDKFSRHCVIGKVSMPLSDVDLVKGGHWWKALVPSSQNEVELGELLLSLNYLPSAGRLNVDIIRAKQLLQTDMSQGSDPFVKIQLVHGLKLTKTKKTSCMRGTIDPFYNESFSFKVPQEELENASLVFTGNCGGGTGLGRVVVGSEVNKAPFSFNLFSYASESMCSEVFFNFAFYMEDTGAKAGSRSYSNPLVCFQTCYNKK
uniref:Synaptotagmin 17 n=1 Tax=Ficedula albicollis TaxID=59894 RepID=A0A803VC65_FICAL